MERAYIPLRLLLDRQRTILETNGRRRHDDATNDEQNADALVDELAATLAAQG
jgi:hypothetical protein